jgi:hypothetical protein
MDCRTFHKKLEDYLEGGLDFPGRFGMERHAQQCYLCGKDVSDAQKLTRAARDIERVKAPAGFEAALLARIQKEHLRNRVGWVWRLPVFWSDAWACRPAAWGALAVTLLGAGIFYVARWNYSDPNGVSVTQKTAARPQEVQPVPLDAENPQGQGRPSIAEVSESLPAKRPKSPHNDAVFSTEESGLSVFAEPAADSGYEQYLIPGPDNRQIIVRLPKTIRMRYGQPSEEYYIRNVSH